jgi:phage shock protein C
MYPPPLDAPRRLYRARNGRIFGVCAGLARYLDMNLGALRLFVVIATVMTGIWPVLIAYVVAGLVMKLEPAMPLENEAEAEFYNSYTGSRTLALHRLKETYDRLDRRIQRMESIVTAREYDWDRRLNE